MRGELVIRANTERLGLSVSACSDAQAASGEDNPVACRSRWPCGETPEKPLYGIFLVPSWCQTILSLPDQHDRSSGRTSGFC